MILRCIRDAREAYCLHLLYGREDNAKFTVIQHIKDVWSNAIQVKRLHHRYTQKLGVLFLLPFSLSPNEIGSQ
jgi:hypothetical protein